MLSVVIPSELSHPALHLAIQLVRQRFVHRGPLVLVQPGGNRLPVPVGTVKLCPPYSDSGPVGWAGFSAHRKHARTYAHRY